MSAARGPQRQQAVRQSWSRWTACRCASSRRIARHHRAERRGQDHVLQPDHRILLPDHGRHPVGRSGHQPSSGRPRVKLGMGRTFQITEIFPELSVRENARIAVETGPASACAAGSAVPTAARRRGVPKSAGPDGPGVKADRLVGELSHGDQRATEIAMALALKPSLLLLDEPTAGMGDAGDVPDHRADPPPAPRFEVHHRADRARYARRVPSRRPHLGAGRGAASG